MKTAATLAVCLAFLAMLAATSRKEPPPPKHPPVPKRTAPATTGWEAQDVFGFKLLTPPHAVVDHEAPNGIHVTFQSGGKIDIEQTAVDIAQIHSEYSSYGEYLYGWLLDEPDAIVPLMWQGGKPHCEITVCHAGWCLVRAQHYLLTDDDCVAAVAIVRNIQ